MSDNEEEAFDFQPSPTYICGNASRRILTGPAADALSIAIQSHTDTFEKYLVSRFEKRRHARRINRHSVLTIDAQPGPDDRLVVTMESSCPKYDYGVLGTEPWQSKYTHVPASGSNKQDHFVCTSLDPIPSTRPTTSNLSVKKVIEMKSALKSLKDPPNEALLSDRTRYHQDGYRSTRGSQRHTSGKPEAGVILEEEDEE